MYLCDDGHEEVCYAGRNCPACEFKLEVEKTEEIADSLQEELDEVTGKIEDQRSEIAALEDTVKELESEIKTLQGT